MLNFEYCVDHLEELTGRSMCRDIRLSGTELSINDAIYLEKNGVISISYDPNGYAILHML